MLNIDFSTVEVGSGAEFDLLPDGKYLVTLNEAELKDTKSGTGKYISAQFRVSSGEHKGRCTFHNFNVENPNPTVVKIGLEQLKKMLTLAGRNVLKLTDVNQLVGTQVGIQLKTKTDSYGKKNEISYFADPKEIVLDEKESDGLPF